MDGDRRTILIVDDDRDFVESVRAILEAAGYAVIHANGGREGLDLARSAAPDLVLMDVIMGERTEGFFTVRQLRRDRALADVPVFVVSSLYEDVPGFRILPDSDWLGHDEFFPKPLDMDLLLAKVASYTAGERAPSPTGQGRPGPADRRAEP